MKLGFMKSYLESISIVQKGTASSLVYGMHLDHKWYEIKASFNEETNQIIIIIVSIFMESAQKNL